MRKIIRSIYKTLQSLLEAFFRLIGTERVILEASEIDVEFLNNFDHIGDYKRVFPFQTQLNVKYAQTRPNLSNGVSDRRDIYAPPINSFSVSSPQIEVVSRKYIMKNVYLENIKTPDITGKSDTQSDNYIYVKKNNGIVKNWHKDFTKRKATSNKECIKIENCPSTKSYFNMHNLKNEESEKARSVLLLELYMS
jgi:hypothetical protein